MEGCRASMEEVNYRVLSFHLAEGNVKSLAAALSMTWSLRRNHAEPCIGHDVLIICHGPYRRPSSLLSNAHHSHNETQVTAAPLTSLDKDSAKFTYLFE
jgi:hypothetical protein